MPGLTGMSLPASTTVTAAVRSSRSANILVNTGGMCCTTTTGTARLAGNALTTRASASGPPVEQPIAMTSIRPVWTVRGDEATAGGAGRAAAGAFGAGGGSGAAEPGDTGDTGRVAPGGGTVFSGGGPAGGARGRRSAVSPRRAHSAWMRGMICSRTLRMLSAMLPTLAGLVT